MRLYLNIYWDVLLTFLSLYTTRSRYRLRYYRCLKVIGEDIPFSEWIKTSSFYIIGRKLDYLDLSIFPPGCQHIYLTECHIDYVFINDTMPCMTKVYAPNANIKDVIGLINLPQLRHLNLINSPIEQLDTESISKHMSTLIVDMDNKNSSSFILAGDNLK